MHDPFVDQLAALCRAYPTRAKGAGHTHALGRTVGERIALEGTSWLNLRFVTPLDIALRMGALFLDWNDVARSFHSRYSPGDTRLWLSRTIGVTLTS
jgi:hypothetical protein